MASHLGGITPAGLESVEELAVTDCLIIGFNDSDFASYVRMVESMGKGLGAYRDLALAYIEDGAQPYRALDYLSHLQEPGGRRYHNTDFLWPTITYLGSFLHKRGHTFGYINHFQMEKASLKDKLRSGEVMTVAITTTLYVSPHPIMEIVSFVREHSEKAKVIIGGPYVSNLAGTLDRAGVEAVFTYIGADFYVINREGEAALASLLWALKKNADLGVVENIAYKRGGEYVFTAASLESNSLEANMIDYRLFSREDLGQFVSLRTAKSCPFSCSFCGFPARAGNYTYLSVEDVERELDALRDVGTVTTLTFLDDTFNVPKERFKKILRMMIRNGYGFKWNSFFRSDHGDEEAIGLMRDSGCEGVFLGAESGSDAVMKNMNKTSRRAHYLKAIPQLRDAGITTHANFIVGFPGETRDTFRETVELIESAKPDFFRAQLWYADPLTPVWKKRDEFGIEGMAFAWSHNTMDSGEACDLIDEMFRTVENSLWLPQWGFELWSVFYLQRWGMSLDGVKTFVKSFNAVIKDKLLHPSRSGILPELRAELDRSCRIGRQGPHLALDAKTSPDPPAVDRTPPGGRDRYTYATLSPEDYDKVLSHFEN
jgi:radical SAM PhpK family P-methyltransferase